MSKEEPLREQLVGVRVGWKREDSQVVRATRMDQPVLADECYAVSPTLSSATCKLSLRVVKKLVNS